MHLRIICFFLFSSVSVCEHQPEKINSVGNHLSMGDLREESRYFYPSNSEVREFIYKKPKEKKQQHFIHIFRPHKEDRNSINEINDEYNTITEKHGKLISEKSSKTSPALSAVALLGFLYFLNLIQNVLQGTSPAKKKREVSHFDREEENISNYLLSFEGIIKKLSNTILSGENEVGDRGFNDLIGYFTDVSRSDESEGRGIWRWFSYFRSLFTKIPQALGMAPKASSRNDDYHGAYSAEASSEGFWSIFGDKVGLVVKIMDFLNDPRPSRVARSSQFEEEERDDFDPKADYAVPIELSDDDKEFLPLYARSSSSNRVKRYTEEEMNIWYSEAHSSPRSKEENASGKIFGMVFNLFKQALTS